jgi:hypothetical protein
VQRRRVHSAPRPGIPGLGPFTARARRETTRPPLRVIDAFTGSSDASWLLRVGVDDWARADATRTDEEITRIRRLIKRIKADVGDLDDTEQARIDDAVAIVRCHRAAHTVPFGMPTLSAPATTSEDTA